MFMCCCDETQVCQSIHSLERRDEGIIHPSYWTFVLAVASDSGSSIFYTVDDSNLKHAVDGVIRNFPYNLFQLTFNTKSTAMINSETVDTYTFVRTPYSITQDDITVTVEFIRKQQADVNLMLCRSITFSKPGETSIIYTRTSTEVASYLTTPPAGLTSVSFEATNGNYTVSGMECDIEIRPWIWEIENVLGGGPINSNPVRPFSYLPNVGLSKRIWASVTVDGFTGADPGCANQNRQYSHQGANIVDQTEWKLDYHYLLVGTRTGFPVFLPQSSQEYEYQTRIDTSNYESIGHSAGVSVADYLGASTYLNLFTHIHTDFLVDAGETRIWYYDAFDVSRDILTQHIQAEDLSPEYDLNLPCDTLTAEVTNITWD